MMFFMVWLIGAISIPFFAPSLPVLAVGEALCGIPWGVFQVRLLHIVVCTWNLSFNVDSLDVIRI